MTTSSRLDVHPRSGLYYFKTEETYKQGKKPQGKVQLAGVQILVETKTDPKYLGGAEYQALRLTSPTHNILCAPPATRAGPRTGRRMALRPPSTRLLPPRRPLPCPLAALLACLLIFATPRRRLRDDPDDGDDDVTDWIPPLEKIIEMQNQGRGMDSLQIGDEEDEDEDYHDGGAAAAAVSRSPR